MRKIAIVNLRHNIKINDKTGEMKSPVFMLKLVNICKKLLTKNMRIFDTNFERLQLQPFTGGEHLTYRKCRIQKNPA